MSAAVLEEVLERLTGVPPELRRFLEYIKVCDERWRQEMQTLKSLQNAYIQRVREAVRHLPRDGSVDLLRATEDPVAMAEIVAKRRDVMGLAEEKIAAANQAWDLVDVHHRKLNRDVSEAEEVLRKNGLFSTEADDLGGDGGFDINMDEVAEAPRRASMGGGAAVKGYKAAAKAVARKGYETGPLPHAPLGRNISAPAFGLSESLGPVPPISLPGGSTAGMMREFSFTGDGGGPLPSAGSTPFPGFPAASPTAGANFALPVGGTTGTAGGGGGAYAPPPSYVSSRGTSQGITLPSHLAAQATQRQASSGMGGASGMGGGGALAARGGVAGGGVGGAMGTGGTGYGSAHLAAHRAASGMVDETMHGGGAAAAGDAATDENQHYCICNKPAYGEMVGCDNKGCEKEWFHLECVGLKAAPTGTWYCPQCKRLREAKRMKGKKGEHA